MKRAATKKTTLTTLIIALTTVVASSAWAQEAADEQEPPSDQSGSLSSDIIDDWTAADNAEADEVEAEGAAEDEEPSANEDGAPAGAVVGVDTIPEDAVPSRIEDPEHPANEEWGAAPAVPVAGAARFAQPPRSEVPMLEAGDLDDGPNSREERRRGPRHTRNAGWATFLSFYSITFINGVMSMAMMDPAFGAMQLIPFVGGMNSIFSLPHMMALGPLSTVGQIAGFITAMVGHHRERRARQSPRISSLTIAPTGPTGEAGLSVAGRF